MGRGVVHHAGASRGARAPISTRGAEREPGAAGGCARTGRGSLEGARRELLEETGYESLAWQPLLQTSIDPSRQTATAHFYCAQAAQQTRAPALDASEDLETLLVSREELLGLVDNGELAHGVHVAAILMAERRGLL